MEESGLKVSIKKSKCEVQYAYLLGRIATTNGHILDPKKMQCLVSKKDPKTKSQVRRFHGGINF